MGLLGQRITMLFLSCLEVEYKSTVVGCNVLKRSYLWANMLTCIGTKRLKGASSTQRLYPHIKISSRLFYSTKNTMRALIEFTKRAWWPDLELVALKSVLEIKHYETSWNETDKAFGKSSSHVLRSKAAGALSTDLLTNAIDSLYIKQKIELLGNSKLNWVHCHQGPSK